MAYVDRTPANNRAVVLGAVALLHGAAGYALITGLAVDYVKELTTIIEGHQIPADPPPPDPAPQPSASPERTDRIVERPRQVVELPVRNQPTNDYADVVLPPLPPQPVATDPVFVPPLPPQPVASFAPRAARPLGWPGTWATTDDYPARDLREGNQGTTRFLLTIGSDGRVAHCAITRSSGFPGLDRATCDKVGRRARFEPATDGSGNRTAGTYEGSIVWVIPGD
jgi:protein TonB